LKENKDKVDAAIDKECKNKNSIDIKPEDMVY
jgi:hypothetical protein